MCGLFKNWTLIRESILIGTPGLAPWQNFSNINNINKNKILNHMYHMFLNHFPLKPIK